ncbi:MCE family protein [Nocardioides bruguierae]|uniref:MCE family protein n=1 Tax=Nocardioides bruguierae TaxID=2945102 RepID=A0A9X2D7H6_9ACTN|nr:MCE family protein [Nocardioides bruguierae]MCM0620801.1 MCE family protein [Nocardioides bruguierae]
MRALTTVRTVLLALVALAVVVTVGVVLLDGDDGKTLTARFTSAAQLYEGSDVRVLGVPVGEITSVRPDGTDVVVTMRYDGELDVPADAQAVVISPSVVGDRYVQLTPAYTGGAVLESGAELGTDRTAVPLELDQVYQSLDDLTVALGPEGANSDGALSDLLVQTAENFGGQGATFRQTLSDFADFTETLDDNSDDLFGASAELGQFLETLADNDTTVRRFNSSLADVSDLLAGERQDLAAALDALATALTQVRRFVDDNGEILTEDVKGLNRVAKVLVKQRAALDETLDAAPLALNNLYLTYNPQAGTLDTNANLTLIEDQLVNDPALLLCTVANSVDDTGGLCDALEGALPRPGALDALRGRSGSTSGAAVLSDATLGGLVAVTE